MAHLRAGEEFDYFKLVNDVIEELLDYLYGAASKSRFRCFLFDYSADAVGYLPENFIEQEIVHHS